MGGTSLLTNRIYVGDVLVERGSEFVMGGYIWTVVRMDGRLGVLCELEHSMEHVYFWYDDVAYWIEETQKMERREHDDWVEQMYDRFMFNQ